MQKNYNTELVLFDLDGTLIDTAPDFHSSLNKILKNNGHDQIELETLRTYVSEGSSELIKFAFKIDESDSDFLKIKTEFLEEYRANLTYLSKPFDGISDVLEFLFSNDIPYGIVTNKPHNFAEPLINSFDLFQNSQILICPDDVSKSKPDPEGILMACKKLNVLPKNTIYLGDHKNDLKAGVSAGTNFIGCLYGYSLNENDSAINVSSPLEIIKNIK